MAVLLRGNRSEHEFFVFLSGKTLDVMEGMVDVPEKLNLPTPKEFTLHTPAIDAYLRRN